MHRRQFPLALLSCVVALSVRADDVPAEVKVDVNVTYRTLDDGKEMKLDIAYPTGEGAHPTVLCVHGGAWRFGSRKELNRWIRYLADDGYVGVAVSYRLLPDGKWPAPIEDCKTAVRFLRANASKYHIDKDRIGALGYSAGGHLVALLGLAGKDAGFEGKDYLEQSSKLQAVVDFYGPSDLTKFGNDESAQKSTFSPLLGGSYKDNPEAYKKASPINYVSKDAPPFLLLHGSKDWLVPPEQSRELYKKLKEAGAQPDLVEIEGASHGFFRDDMRKANEAVLKFLAEQLKK
jgi:acetyl esterase/lipase